MLLSRFTVLSRPSSSQARVFWLWRAVFLLRGPPPSSRTAMEERQRLKALLIVRGTSRSFFR
jgi:hypothetical protein